MAKLIPGKEEFYETLRYFSRKIEITGVDVRLNSRVDAPSLLAADPPFDAVIVATGVRPRRLTFEGSDHPKVGRLAGAVGKGGVCMAVVVCFWRGGRREEGGGGGLFSVRCCFLPTDTNLLRNCIATAFFLGDEIPVLASSGESTRNWS